MNGVAWATALVFLITGLAFRSAAGADAAAAAGGEEPTLQGHHPSIAGLAYTDADRGYIDIQVSLKYPLIPNAVNSNGTLFFGYSHKAAFYRLHWGEDWGRQSSSVVNILFNPELFWRLRLEPDRGRRNRDAGSYLDVGISHESNGQTISKEETYRRLQQDLAPPDNAHDYISRSWNSLFVSGHWAISERWHAFPKLKLLGLYDTEDYYDWEDNDRGIRIKDVDGLRLTLLYSTFDDHGSRRSGSKLSLGLTSGTTRHARQSARIAWTVAFETKWMPPVTLWYSHGYDNDLADYYKRVTAFGIGFELLSFPSRSASPLMEDL
jgi:outer membrane phospholipase A